MYCKCTLPIKRAGESYYLHRSPSHGPKPHRFVQPEQQDSPPSPRPYNPSTRQETTNGDRGYVYTAIKNLMAPSLSA